MSAIPLNLVSPPSLDVALNEQLNVLQEEINSLKTEIGLLRSRDETVNLYMQRVDEELRLAARLQQDFLPRSLPQVGRVRCEALFRPAAYVSGDLYDVMRLDENHIGFYMADAVGHGMPAALLTMFIKQALMTKEIVPGGYRLLEPAQTMGRLNDALCEQNLSQATFATAIYGVMNTDTYEVTFARGGHPAPVHLRPSGLEMLDVDGSLLGIFPNEVFDQRTVKLQPGERLFVYSDGVEVAFSDDNNLDTMKWREELDKRRTLTAQELIADITNHLDGESGSLTPKDDLTMIIIEVE